MSMVPHFLKFAGSLMPLTPLSLIEFPVGLNSLTCASPEGIFPEAQRALGFSFSSLEIKECVNPDLVPASQPSNLIWE